MAAEQELSWREQATFVSVSAAFTGCEASGKRKKQTNTAEGTSSDMRVSPKQSESGATTQRLYLAVLFSTHKKPTMGSLLVFLIFIERTDPLIKFIESLRCCVVNWALKITSLSICVAGRWC